MLDGDEDKDAQHGSITQQLAYNLLLARQRYRRQRQAQLQTSGKLQVVVTCWSLSENPAGRAYTLASLYQDLVDHPDQPDQPDQQKNGVRPLPDLATHSIEQLLEHWLQRYDGLPAWNNLPGRPWTELGMSLCHARDPAQFRPSAERRQRARAQWRIAPEQQVVLFLGTPRRHKGLLETAQALSSLTASLSDAAPSLRAPSPRAPGQPPQRPSETASPPSQHRPNLLFLIAGSFPASEQPLRAALEAEQARGRLALRLLDDQPFAAIPELKRVVMLTLRATLEPDGQIKLPPHVRHQEPVSVLITFLDEPVSVPGEASAAVTLALLRSPAFQSLPTSDPNEIEQRIADLRNDWNDD